MTERKPTGLSFESWIDGQIREAEARGEFDGLPGSGKPLPDAGRPLDDNWWIKQKLAGEGLVAMIHPTLGGPRRERGPAAGRGGEERRQAERWPVEAPPSSAASRLSWAGGGVRARYFALVLSVLDCDT
ncbi:DUF1992 domain-containing protein [Actinomadura soli]|uniref:DUF1992 domain-containing protein n=1 Tax=Actinomadura soli TaxID=2508997 RepID=A0A5C4JK13_9ACTN|nr:DUF1992 domain-containing protein [Actinomadura soli]TMR07429.1 DUF1992 domain-containing protein [Actinomadura soli]